MSNRLNAQKLEAIRLHWAGLGPEEACASAGYARPNQAAERIFATTGSGKFGDAAVQAEWERLDEGGGLTDEDIDGMDLTQVARATLVEMATSKSSTPTARVAAARALDKIGKDEQTLAAGCPCPTCGKSWAGTAAEDQDAKDRARARIREMLGMT